MIGLHLGTAILGNYYLSRFNIPQKSSAQRLNRAGFRGKDNGVLYPSHAQRAKAVWVTGCDQTAAIHDHHGICADQIIHGIQHSVCQGVSTQMLPYDHIGDDLGIIGALKNAAAILRLCPQSGAVDQLSVITQRQRTGSVMNDQRLDIAGRCNPSANALPNMAHSGFGSVKGIQMCPVKHIRHQSLCFVHLNIIIKTYRNTAGILSSVLKRIEGLIGSNCRIGLLGTGRNAENAAFFL